MHCWGKIKAIQEKTGLICTVDEVTHLCIMWANEWKAEGNKEPWTREQTVQKINDLDPEKLKQDVLKAKRRAIMMNYVSAEQKVYA